MIHFFGQPNTKVFGLSFSQVKLEGFVKDALGNPLELAAEKLQGIASISPLEEHQRF